MLMCLLQFSFLFLPFASAESSEVLLAIKDLVEEGNGTAMGTLAPHTNSLRAEDLKALESTLQQPLQEASRAKRQVGNFNSQYMFDETTDGDDLSDERVDSDVRSTLREVELPFSKGHSAFSIRANTVYILYPSAFQDPNIFGRFAINQNMDAPKEMRTTLDGEHESLPPDALKLPSFNSLQYPQSRSFGESEAFNQPAPYARQFRRSATDFSLPSPSSFHQQYLSDEAPSSQEEEQNEKRNVETHLSGTIVVLNQDVNERNIKESY